MRRWSQNRGEREPASRDWMVLTAVCLCTGLAILNTMGQNIDRGLPPLDSELSGQIVLTMYAEKHELCEGGIEALQAREDTRAAKAIARGQNPRAVNVSHWIATYHLGQSDEDLMADYGAYLWQIDRQADWTRDTTLGIAIECEIKRRGLI